MKKLLTATLILCSLLTIISCSKTSSDNLEGKVLNIYVWNDEFEDRFNRYFPKDALGDVKVNFIKTDNAKNAYQNKLDEVLLMQDQAAPDEKADIFLLEADYALKYVDTPYTLDVIKDIGLTEQELSNQFKYTKDVMTDSRGALKGVSWQGTPGGFIYRRSYAKEVLGTDDPYQVQKYLKDWKTFDETAAKMKAAGYFMLSGFDDDFRVFSDNVTSPWVKGNRIVIDDQIKAWIKQTKEYTLKDYNNRASLFTEESTQGMMKDGKVFGYFGPAWFLDFQMPHGEGSAYGDWAVCKGPQSFSWGGTWLCGASCTDNISLIRKIMRVMTCDADTMAQLAMEMGDFANNSLAMQKVAVSDYKNEFLGGQNHVALFIDSAVSINKNCMSMYDQGMIERIQSSMKDYFEGTVTEEEAWDNFYTSVLEIYPNLSR